MTLLEHPRDNAKFPDSFVWGAASSSYQIEGGASASGRGASVWDSFCNENGTVRDHSSGDVACDHFHRYADDVELMAQIGLQAYRLSLSWSRVLPDGVGAVSKEGLGFYDSLIDTLLAAGIEPWVTLFHWDFPQALADRGGWCDRASADWFAEYTRVVVERLSDRVSHWITINEPQCFLHLGHATGVHAPGLKLPFTDQLLAAHHVLLAHGKSVEVIRQTAKTTARVGMAPVGMTYAPLTESSADIEAARHKTFDITKKDLWCNAWFMDPVCKGEYPADGLEFFGDAVPQFSATDVATIQQPIDFIGLNIYSAECACAGDNGKPESMPLPVGIGRTSLGWALVPESLYWGPKFYHDRYRLPIVITENGMANNDWVDRDGRVRDSQRIDYTGRHLVALQSAIEDGVEVDGYFHWTLMDNFEWAEGYCQRFGLVHVDFQTQVRTFKDSAHWYRQVIESDGAVLNHGRSLPTGHFDGE